MVIESYEHENGRLYIVHSDKNLSIGLLVLNPHQELEKHKRPVTEQLIQIQGSSIIKIFHVDILEKETTLKEGDKLTISSDMYHVHANSSGQKSVTLWKFEGDITEVINDIRKRYKRV